MELVPVDAYEDGMLAACHRLERASIDHDRPAGLPRTLAELTHHLRGRSVLQATSMIAAVADGEVVGTMWISLSLLDNLHLADAMIHVHPDHRRAGVGSTLYDALVAAAREAGRTTVLADVEVSLSPAQPGVAFATAQGFETVHQEDRLTLALPATLARLRTDLADVRMATWSGACPDEHVAAYCRLRTQMEADVPLGEIDYDRPAFDETRLRAVEDDVLATRDIVCAMALVDGEPAGYSGVTMDRDDTEVHQEDTLVMPAHRGRGLATQLKIATLDVVQRDSPERRTLHTWTDPDNTAMYDVNLRFGFTVAERVHEMQGQVAPR